MAAAIASEDGEDQDAPARVSPSEFMRELRPEYYSDTVQRPTHVLSADRLEYHLDSLTSRNQTHEFEIFCRKLCERTICPNLRPQTGPDGGGDSKADTETYPVSDEVSGLTYIGDANSGRERWAFAFSAKKEWSVKVRADVKGIAETGRGYDKIIFVTSRFAKAKDRARIEDELSKQYSIRVTILDRSWIVTEIIEKERTDLAFNYLKVGDDVSARRLGPKDYSRAQQLADIERAIEDPAAFQGMERQLVTEALVAAKLSRGLERPRTEIDGRFARAIRLAEAHGSYRQKLEARYEQIWTAFWWYNDFNLLNASYDDFEARALESTHAKNLEFLGNLNQLLVNSIVHDHMTREQCRYDERTARLKRALDVQARDASRPNNSLEAETDLQRIAVNRAILAQDETALSSVFNSYCSILDKAKGLGEFDADGVIRFIEVIGGVAGNDPAYNELVEKLADFVGTRKSEAEGALVLLKRAQKLDLSADKFDMIRWLGKAAVGLTKRECTAELIDATQLLTLAYRSAGLHWAARASCCLAAASIIVEGEKDGDLPASIIPTMKIWAWNALELCHLPDVLFAIQLLNGCLAGLPLTEESKAKVREDLIELDMALGCLFLNLKENDLRRLEETPDILASLSLFMSRTALLYSLGHPEVLREDGSLPKEETDEAVNRLLSTLKSQPLAESLRGPLLLNQEGRQVLVTTIMGMKVEVEVLESRHIPLAECVLGSIEAFFATVIEKRVAPHTELFRISIIASEQAQDPAIETSELDMKSTVTWPASLPLVSIDRQGDINQFYCEVAAHILGAACSVKDGTALLDELFADAAVQQRIAMISSAPNSYSRTASQTFSSLADWKKLVSRSYPLREQRAEVPRIKLAQPDDEIPDFGEDDGSLGVKNHKGISIRSVIDVHAWDRARWQGCGYIQIGHSLPCMAFLFEDKEGARKIFERWRERFGAEDAGEQIGVSIIRNLPDMNPHHYCVQIASADPLSRGAVTKAPVMVATRSMTMEPNDSRNLDTFLAGYQHHGAFYLLPAIGRVNPEPFYDLAIVKRDLTVKSAADVLDHEIEALALRMRGLKTPA
ncbi:MULTISPECIES: hypothetical protein [Bradyrhizobium]|nr:MULTISPECIES: hypothetical protein [Bradyrhizobium]